MATSYMRGHHIHTTSDDFTHWFYEDGAPADDSRPCPRCGKHSGSSEDSCLGHIDGVRAACCGHGIQEGYVVLENGFVIIGQHLRIEIWAEDVTRKDSIRKLDGAARRTELESGK